MGNVKSNPLPDHTDDAKLAEEFAHSKKSKLLEMTLNIMINLNQL